MSKGFRCVVFDMDGTLTDTNTLIFHSFNHVAEKFLGRRLSPEEIISFFGPPEEGAVENMLGAAHLPEAMTLYYAFYAERHNDYASLHDGMREVLDLLKKKGVRLGLFTGKGRRTTDISLEKLSIASYFDVIMSGDDVAEYKPSGDGLRRIMAQVSIQPEQTLMVGDAVGDIVAARDAGVPVASVLWDSYGKEEVLKMDSDFVFQSVDEFAEWIFQNI
ncbi:MAG: HAD-IA family hydrolase [Ignavibacteriales bacterium]|nr:HAD-IA family hydrolase [Ignavibacteriales bacterium]